MKMEVKVEEGEDGMKYTICRGIRRRVSTFPICIREYSNEHCQKAPELYAITEGEKGRMKEEEEKRG